MKLKKYGSQIISFLKYIIIPPIVTIILNFGLIFKIENKIPLLDTIIIHLSSKNITIPYIPLFIGLTTIFALFFSFAPIVYSRRYIPTNVYPDYILPHKNTYRYFGKMLGIGFVYFTLSITPLFNTVHNLLIAVIILIIAIIVSVRYFFWITKIIIPKNLIPLMLKPLNFTGIEEIEKELIDAKNTLNLDIKRFEEKMLDNTDLLFQLGADEPIEIKTNQIGLVSSINLREIFNILDKYNDQINHIALLIDIGESIPNPGIEREPDEPIPTTLLNIYLKDFENNDIDKQKIKNSILEESNSIIKYINIKSDHPHASVYKYVIDNVLSLYDMGLQNDVQIANQVINAIDKKIYEEYKNDNIYSWDSKIKIREEIYLTILDAIGNISESNFTSKHLDSILRIIYNLMQIASKNSRISMAYEIQNKMGTVFTQIITEHLHLRRKNRILLLHLKEVVFSYETSSKFKKLTDEKKEIYWNDYYKPSIYNGINNGVNLYYLLISYSYLFNDNENESYLSHNAQYLIDFISSLFHLEDFFYDEDDSGNYLKNDIITLINSLASNIMYLSILVYRKIMSDELPIKFFNSICYPMAQNAINTGKYLSLNVDELHAELFFDHEFNTPIKSVISDAFELNKVHETSTYTPRFYNFNSFWLSLSYKRHIEGKISIPCKLPSNIKRENIHMIIDKLTRFYFTISSGDTELIKIEGQKSLESFYYNYKSHIRALIDQAKVLENNFLKTP